MQLDELTYVNVSEQNIDQVYLVIMQEGHSQLLCFLNGPNPASFCLFSIFSYDKYCTNLTIYNQSVDSVLGTQTK